MFQIKSITTLIILVFGLSLCSSCFDPISCTEEFRTVTLEIVGGTLDNHYTIRLETGDTLQHNSSILPFYPVLDDNFQKELEGSQEEFRFIGEIADSIVVSELYLISADACHIELVTGATLITL